MSGNYLEYPYSNSDSPGVQPPNDIGGGSGGGNTPNISIAGTDNVGNVIESLIIKTDVGAGSIVQSSHFNNAAGINGVAFGNSSSADGDYSTSLGKSSADEDYALSTGNGTTASGEASISGGTGTTASGDNSLVVGKFNTGYGDSCLVTGSNNTASGQDSRTSGNNNNAAGDRSSTDGSYNNAHYHQTVIGRYAVDDANANDVETAGQNVFKVGWGDSVSSKDIFKVNAYGMTGGTPLTLIDVLNSTPNVGFKTSASDVIGVSLEFGGLAWGGCLGINWDSIASLNALPNVLAGSYATLANGTWWIKIDAPVSPKTNYAYILPSSGNFDDTWRVITRTSFKLKLKPTGPANTFTSVRVALPNTGAAYTINSAYVMRSTNTNTSVTGNTATGLLAVTTLPVVIAAGTDENPVWTDVGDLNTFDGPVSDFVLLIECDSGCLNSFWGDFSTPAMGWIVTNEEVLDANLSSGISFAGTNSYGTIPPVAIKFEGLSTEVVSLPFIGDSWLDGYGDVGPIRPYGLEGRLNGLWVLSGLEVAPFMFARTGYKTPQSVNRLESLLTWFDVKALVVQFNSLNNVTSGLPAGTCRTSWQDIEILAGTRRLIPICGGGMTSSITNWWIDWLADQAWMVARNSETDINYLDNLVNIADGTVTPALAFTDGAHPNSSGYTQWADDSVTHLSSIIASWG